MRQFRNFLFLPVTLLAFLFLAQALALAAQELKTFEGVAKPIPSATISFSPGSSFLSAENKATLSLLAQEAREKGVIEKVTVAAWSDKNLPALGETTLDPDRTLAQNRAAAIADYLRSEEKVRSIERFNMAENSNWLARTFNTREAELKSQFGKTGAQLPVTNAEFQLIKSEGGPAKAIVIVERKIR